MTKYELDAFLRKVKRNYPHFWEGEDSKSKRLLYDEWTQALADVQPEDADAALRDWMAKWDYMTPTPDKLMARIDAFGRSPSALTPLMRDAIRRLEDGGDR